MAVSSVASLDVASTIRPCLGESVSGDAVIVKPIEDGLFVAIVDVLGHGPEAAELAGEIEIYLTQYACRDVSALMKRLHQRLKGSRGAAVGLSFIETEGSYIEYTGVGNTVIRRFGETETRLVSQDGVLGQNMRTPRPQRLDLENGDLIVLYTDGVSDRFSSKDYPGVFLHAADMVAKNIVQRFGKGHDDAACIAVRYSA
ncbi:MAG: SpoIIE family protein phosphatase [Halioglobus sp.]